ncbi:MAG TPA: hemerythrin domain-containing protein [Geobacteraceae bacterium]
MAEHSEREDIFGDEEADRQHRELFAKSDEFMAALDGNVYKKDLLQMFKFLDDYVSSHFAAEERLFDRYAYPGAAEHREEHRLFVLEMWTVKSKLSTGGSLDEALRATSKALVEWLARHVDASDVAAGDYIRKMRGRDGSAS